MPSDEQWTTARIAEAMAQHPSVTDEVSSQLTEALKGQLSEQQLSQRELTDLAKALIVGMGPTPPGAGEKR